MPKHVASRSRSNARGRSTTRRPTKRVSTSKTKKGKTSKSRSKSMLKKKSGLNNTAQQVGNAHWLSYGKTFASKGNNFLRKLEKVMTPSFYIQNSTFQLTVTPGVQINTNFNAYGDTDIQNLSAALTIQPGVIQGPIVNSRTLLISAKEKFTFTNTSNTNVFIDIYDIVNRRDVMYNLQTTNSPSPSICWSQGDLNSYAATDYSTTYGSTPFQSRMFTQMYKILRKTRINLTNGETAEHVKHIRPNRIWDNMLDNLTPGSGPTGKGAGYQYIRNLTNWTLFVCYAAPGSNHTTSTIVSTASPVIDFIHTIEYKSALLMDNSTNVSVSNNISTAGVTNVTAFGAGTSEAVENAA